VHRTTLGDLHQAFVLIRVQASSEVDLLLDSIHPSLSGLTLRTIFGMDLSVVQPYAH
jgi:hypothetical protein